MTTPPPNSFGQPQYGQPQQGQPQYGQPQFGQQPYGQPQAGQPPYPTQPQYGQPPYPTQPYEAPVPPEKKGFSWKAKIFFAGSGLVLVALVGAAVWSRFFGNLYGAYAGDCLQYSTPNNGKIVKCSSAEANTVVLKRFDVLPSMANCDNVPGAIAKYGSNYRSKGKYRSYSVCLGPHTPGKSK